MLTRMGIRQVFYHYDIRLHQEGDERIVTYVIIIYVYDIRRNV